MGLTFKQKEDNFTKFLCEEARKQGCVFYEESGEGHDLETDTMYLEDVGGYLAPIGTSEEQAKTEENYRFAEWKMGDDGMVSIDFVQY